MSSFSGAAGGGGGGGGGGGDDGTDMGVGVGVVPFVPDPLPPLFSARWDS